MKIIDPLNSVNDLQATKNKLFESILADFQPGYFFKNKYRETIYLVDQTRPI